MPAPQARSKPKNDQPVFFYRPKGRYGIFCQWYPSPFKISNAAIEFLVGSHIMSPAPDACTEFSCAEQFMMYCKAARFSDTYIQGRVMNTSDPNGHKRLGKRVEGFCEEGWTEVKSQVVEMGNYAKFAQDSQLQGWLLGTGDRELVEAASGDRVWGIGFPADTDAQVQVALDNRSHWGENRLGKALMAVRAKLREEMAAGNAEDTATPASNLG